MKILVQAPVKTHIISGFLGAGKTTVLQHLLQQKPEHETWAVLMNEFGQIGIDQQLLIQQPGYVVKELLGGCLCCSSQLPMQLALSRLIHDLKPDRLFIEPTGLGHPAQLLDQLSEPHWQESLSLAALVTVVDGSRLHDSTWSEQQLYQDQLKAAQIVLVSHADMMNVEDMLGLEQLKSSFLAEVGTWLMVTQGQIQLEQIDVASRPRQRKIVPLLQQQRSMTAAELPKVIQQLPYHYTETNQGFSVVGWRFSKRWQFDFYNVLDLLSEQQDWLRIKAIFYTNQGWTSFNFNPQQFNYQSCPEGLDNRIEIILKVQQDWENFEAKLLACRLTE